MTHTLVREDKGGVGPRIADLARGYPNKITLREAKVPLARSTKDQRNGSKHCNSNEHTGVQHCNQTKVEPQPACIYPTNPHKPSDFQPELHPRKPRIPESERTREVLVPVLQIQPEDLTPDSCNGSTPLPTAGASPFLVRARPGLPGKQSSLYKSQMCT